MAKRNLAAELELLKQQALEQQRISTSLEGYMDGLRQLKKIRETIVANQEIEKKLQKELIEITKKGNLNDIALAQKKLGLLQDQTDELRKQDKVLADNLEKVNKGNLATAKILAGSVKAFAAMPKLIEASYGRLKGFGLFEMSKATKQSALQMGLLGERAKEYGKNINRVAMDTLEIGIGVEQLAKMQSAYSEELGRTVELSDKGMHAMAEMAKATMLGEEGAAKMAADMDAQGKSAEGTAEYVKQTMNDSHAMGLNASSVIKKVAGSMKMLNKYNFKDGAKGLANLAKTVTKLGVSMEFVAAMADKAYNIEGAVEMSARLQVLGGAWAELADPFKLLNLATEDMNGLAEAVGKAAEQSVTLNQKTGEMSISAAKMRELKVVAEATGLSLEEVAEAGKKARKFTEMKRQMSFVIPPDLQEFMAATGQLNEKGEATIKIKGEEKLLKTLTSAQVDALRAEMGQKKDLEARAKESRTFDEAITNTLNMFKTALLPFIETLNADLMPKVDSFVKELKEGKWFDKIGDYAKKFGEIITWFGTTVLENWKYALAGLALFKTASWVLNGMALAKGFNMFVKGPGGISGQAGGGAMDFIGGKMGQTKGGSFGGNLKGGLGSTLLKVGGVVAGLTAAYTEFSENQENKMGTGENIGRTASKGVGAGLGMWGGAAAGAAIGSMVPVIGTVIGGLIGGALGAYGGSALGEGAGDALYGAEKVNAGYFPPSKHNRQIIQDGVATPIHDEDKAMIVGKKLAKKDTGSKTTTSNSSGVVEHKFDTLKIEGSIMVNSPGNPGLGVDLLKNPEFLRNITVSVMNNLERNRNQVIQG